MRKFFLLISIFFLFSFSGVSLKKRISDASFRYEFYTTNKTPSAKTKRSYYWFKGGAIHNSEAGIGGELLHNDFRKFYHSNQLAEDGRFNNGLKEGYWKSWFENGVLQSTTYWHKGRKDGSYQSYDQTGFMTEKGRYNNDKKQGRWISYISKDTLTYKNDRVVHKKVEKAKVAKDTLAIKKDRPGFFKRLFSGKKSKRNEAQMDSSKSKTERKSAKPVGSKKQERQSNKNVNENKSNHYVNTEQEEKPGFFKRLFSKKTNSNTQK